MHVEGGKEAVNKGLIVPLPGDIYGGCWVNVLRLSVGILDEIIQI